jgi:DNA-binding NtrC family response regulator
VPSSVVKRVPLSAHQPAIRILIVEDDLLLAKRLVKSLSIACPHYNFCYVSNFEDALKLNQELRPAAAIVDLSLSKQAGPEQGLELIEKLVSGPNSTRVIVLTGEDSDNYGLKCIHAGASSFNQKPTTPEKLLTLLEDAVNTSQIKKARKASGSENYSIKIKSYSHSMKEVIELADFAAHSSQPLLLVGETGTGKGWLAKKIHQASKSKQLVRYQPTFTSADLVNSELFGHEKGAFTGALNTRVGLIETANKGSLFIDEIDSLSNESQVMLLETLQERSFRRVGSNRLLSSSFRLITASNQGLEALAGGDVLRKDFFHRISHLRIELPPLRERKEDIIPLAESFLTEISNSQGCKVHLISDSANAMLSSYSWPGNIRELMAVIESAAWLANYRKKSIIEAEEIKLNQSSRMAAHSKGNYREQLEEFNRKILLSAIELTEGNKTEAARLLGLDRSTFRRLLKSLSKKSLL